MNSAGEPLRPRRTPQYPCDALWNRNADIWPDTSTFSEFRLIEDVLPPPPFPPGYVVPLRPAAVELGLLDRLPAEILLMVLTLIDLRSLFVFRRVNRAATGFVDSIEQLKTIRRYARHTLRGMQILRADRWSTIQDLYDALFRRDCTICGEFGSYLWLLTCQRYCNFCTIKSSDVNAVDLHQALRAYDLTAEDLQNVPRIEVLATEKLRPFLGPHDEDGPAGTVWLDRPSLERVVVRKQIELAKREPHRKQTHVIISWIRVSSTHRFYLSQMCSSSFPYIDKAQNEVRWGYYWLTRRKIYFGSEPWEFSQMMHGDSDERTQWDDDPQTRMILKRRLCGSREFFREYPKLIPLK